MHGTRRMKSQDTIAYCSVLLDLMVGPIVRANGRCSNAAVEVSDLPGYFFLLNMTAVLMAFSESQKDSRS